MAIEKTTRDFRIHPMTLAKWMHRTDITEATKPSQSRTEAAELRDTRKRIRLLKQEVEMLRHAAMYLSQANLPRR